MSTQLSRRTIMTMLGGAVVGHTSAWGHDLRPGDPSYRFQDYEAIVNRSARVKQVYEWPNIANARTFRKHSKWPKRLSVLVRHSAR